MFGVTSPAELNRVGSLTFLLEEGRGWGILSTKCVLIYYSKHGTTKSLKIE